jgi:hypothetical protein
VELQNKLLELFIDVPISFVRGDGRTMYIHQAIVDDLAGEGLGVGEKETQIARGYAPQEGYYYEAHLPPLGAATFLLHAIGQTNVPRMVLEGAPGQGKSTIVQYVCQVHRMRLLSKEAQLAMLPENHKNGPLRVPIKVDLRDFAAWLIRKDPFAPVDSEVQPALWHRSLESFLAFLIRSLSGGSDFTVDDLTAVAKLSSLLLVFDGLDEVAEISRRRDVVEEISKGLRRISVNAASLQAIVTSRPAAFANSPGFPNEEFPYYQLVPVTKPLISEYADKWLKARRLKEREGAEVKRILETKLHEPHIRELAKTPMQLAILLSLVHTRGESLPDKRTALYDSYIELFFSREAAKSSVVRDHRDLLIDIHRYLAWVLHSEAEQGKERGSITSERLQPLLTEYLRGEGQDPTLAGKLFTGMVERVGALVSRVQGTYEFEVQPLREYFAARYLYDTAPYSPPGNERRGTKPDRFDAIARNFYWLNVARFYAGCFSKGESASLVDRLEDLIHQVGYAPTSHPRSLALTLLSDWVFTQHPKFVKDVLALAIDGNGLKLLLAASGGPYRVSPGISLPKKCGGDTLVERCFAIMSGDPPIDYLNSILGTASANASLLELKALWLNLTLRAEGEARSKLLSSGAAQGVFQHLTEDELNQLSSRGPLGVGPLFTAIHSGKADIVEADDAKCRTVVDAVLDADYPGSQAGETILDQFASAVHPYRYARAFDLPTDVPLGLVWKKERYFEPIEPERFTGRTYGRTLQACLMTISMAKSVSEGAAGAWANTLGPWNDLVEYIRKTWGDRMVTYFMANVASGIRSSSETCNEFSSLSDRSQPLCKRSRYARLRAGTASWWRSQLSELVTPSDQVLASLLLLTWGSPKTLLEVCQPLQIVLDAMAPTDWRALIRCTLGSVSILGSRTPRGSLSVVSLPDGLSPRTVAAFGARAKGIISRQLYDRYLSDYKGSDPPVLEFCQEQALDLDSIYASRWKPDLEQVARTYAQGVLSSAARRLHERRSAYPSKARVEICKRIIAEADRFPISLVAIAELTCRTALSSKIVPVAEVAVREGWFSQ